MKTVMSIEQFILAANEMNDVFARRVWKVDIVFLPKLERVAKHAFNELNQFHAISTSTK